MDFNNPYSLDIETIPNRADEYHAFWPDDDKQPGIHAIISEVVCVCILDIDTENMCTIDRQDFTSERDILMQTYIILKNKPRDLMVTFNGKNFDVPVLALRGAHYHIALGMILPYPKGVHHLDIFEDVLGGKWKTDNTACSQSKLYWSLFKEMPDTESGSHVAEMWAAGNLKGISEHCEEDCVRLAKIYRTLKGVMF